MNKKFFLAVTNIITLCVIIGAISLFFANDSYWIGFVLILLAALCLISLVPFKISLKSAQPDIFFGIIDNGILAIMAIFGGHFGGVTGAILGGVVGNAITDGIAGIFEGYAAEKFSKDIIKECVAVIAECSLPSTGQGIELGWASVYNIPIICIHEKGSKISSALHYVSDTFIEYSDKVEMIEKLQEYLDKLA